MTRVHFNVKVSCEYIFLNYLVHVDLTILCNICCESVVLLRDGYFGVISKIFRLFVSLSFKPVYKTQTTMLSKGINNLAPFIWQHFYTIINEIVKCFMDIICDIFFVKQKLIRSGFFYRIESIGINFLIEIKKS